MSTLMKIGFVSVPLSILCVVLGAVFYELLKWKKTGAGFLYAAGTLFVLFLVCASLDLIRMVLEDR